MVHGYGGDRSYRFFSGLLRWVFAFYVAWGLGLVVPVVGQSLEIHHINVGQGDAGLVINRDLEKVKRNIIFYGKTPPDDPFELVPYAVKKEIPLGQTVRKVVLIDGGHDESHWTYKKILEYIRTYVQQSYTDADLLNHEPRFKITFDSDNENTMNGDKVLKVAIIKGDAVIKSSKACIYGNLTFITNETSALFVSGDIRISGNIQINNNLQLNKNQSITSGVNTLTALENNVVIRGRGTIKGKGKVFSRYEGDHSKFSVMAGEASFITKILKTDFEEDDEITITQESLSITAKKKDDKVKIKINDKSDTADYLESNKSNYIVIEDEYDLADLEGAAILITEDKAKKRVDTKFPLDIVISHYDKDHVGGLFYVLAGYTDTRAYKGQNYDYDFQGMLPIVDTVYDLGKQYLGDYKASFDKLNEESVSREKIIPGNTVVDLKKIPLNGAEKKVKMKAIAANGFYIKKWDQSKPTQQVDDPYKAKPNLRSSVFILEYGDFRYFFGGDTEGTGSPEYEGKRDGSENMFRKKNTPSKTMEPVLVEALPTLYPQDNDRGETLSGHVCGYKASHHGSAYSNDVKLLATLQPVIVAISAGSRPKDYSHPNTETIYRFDKSLTPKWPVNGNKISNSIQKYFITAGSSIWKPDEHERTTDRDNFTPNPKLFKNGYFVGDIIIRPFDEDASKPSDEPHNIRMEVRGTGRKNDEDSFSFKLDTGNRLGPFIITCNFH